MRDGAIDIPRSTYSSINFSPAIITNSPPHSIVEYLHSSLLRATTTNQPNWILCRTEIWAEVEGEGEVQGEGEGEEGGRSRGRRSRGRRGRE